MEMIASTLITVLFVLSILHYIYESIIVPNQRMILRDDLFELRDKLRNSYGEYNEADRKAFDVLHDKGINHGLNNLSLYCLLSQIKVYLAVERNPELKENAEKQIEIINNASHQTIIDSFSEYSRIIEKAHMLNSGGWSFYIIPIAIVIVFAQRIKKAIIRSSFLPHNDNNQYQCA